MQIRKCVIPIAGKGTRFLPITKSVSKEMLPIVNEPTIFLQVQECYKSGIDEIIFVVGHHNYDLVKSFFSDNADLNTFLKDDSKKELLNDINNIINNVKFHYVFQDENIRGTAGAVYSAKNYINDDEYFAVMFGDDLFDCEIPALKQLIELHEKYNCNVCGCGIVPIEKISNYGVIKYKKDNIVESIYEKPNRDDAPSNHAIEGRFIVHGTFMNNVLNSLKHNNNEYYFVETLFLLKEEVRTKIIEGNYYDIGSHLGYLKANIAYGLKKDNIKKDLIKYIKSIGE